MFPTNIVRTDIPKRKGIHMLCSSENAVKKNLAIKAKAAAFVATDMKPVMGVGAPW